MYFFFCYSFDYTVKKQSWVGGGTRSVKFAHAATAAPMVKIEILLDFFDVFFLFIVESN